MNTTNTNNFAPVVEEQIFEQEQNQLHDILNQFKQPIPKGFIELKTEGENYIFSTPTSWPKLVCERYSFIAEQEWITLDIPHSLLEKLELKIGEEITYPIYLSPKVLQRKEICKGITLESEEEIFVDRPVSEKNAKKELNKRLNELEDLRGKISEKDNEIIMLKEKLQGKELELGNYAHISNKDWEEDYKNRPTRKELDEVKQKMNNPILSMINCVLDNNEAGELKNYFLELLELVEKLDFSQQGCERKAAAKLIKSFFLLSKKNNQWEISKAIRDMQGYKLLILRNYVEYDHNQNEQIICCEKLADEQGGLYSSDWIDGCFLDPAGMGSKVEEINFFSQVDKFSNLRQWLESLGNFPNLKKVILDVSIESSRIGTVYLPDGQQKFGAKWAWIKGEK